MRFCHECGMSKVINSPSIYFTFWKRKSWYVSCFFQGIIKTHQFKNKNSWKFISMQELDVRQRLFSCEIVVDILRRFQKGFGHNVWMVIASGHSSPFPRCACLMSIWCINWCGAHFYVRSQIGKTPAFILNWNF